MLQLQFRSLDPGKHLRSPVVELPSYVISYFATGEVLGMGILEEFLEFNTKSEQENIREEVLFRSVIMFLLLLLIVNQSRP